MAKEHSIQLEEFSEDPFTNSGYAKPLSGRHFDKTSSGHLMEAVAVKGYADTKFVGKTYRLKLCPAPIGLASSRS